MGDRDRPEETEQRRVQHHGERTRGYCDALKGEKLTYQFPSVRTILRATNDVFAGAKAHTVVVTGNDLPGTVGDNGIQAGATYWYETAAVTPTGVQVDDNAGKCYSITMLM
jgi:hypothetical protein